MYCKPAAAVVEDATQQLCTTFQDTCAIQLCEASVTNVHAGTGASQAAA